MDYADTFFQLKSQIDEILKRTGREKDSVTILPVSKTVPVEKIREAYQAGMKRFAESRVQELLEKRSVLPSDIEWDFIGHLQTNKAKQIGGEVGLIHSLDSLRLAECLNEIGQKKNCRIPVLIEVNTSQETSKFGFSPENLEAALEDLQRLSNLEFRGLMTLGPLTEDRDRSRRSFALLRQIKERIQNRFDKMIFKELSMGMSQDFEPAIEEGATLLRIGTLLFGEREK
jgi:hypothetical protein